MSMVMHQPCNPHCKLTRFLLTSTLLDHEAMMITETQWDKLCTIITTLQYHKAKKQLSYWCIFNDNKIRWYDRSRDRRKNNNSNNNSIFKFGQVCLGDGVLSFHNFGNLGGQLKTRYDDAFGEKRKGDLYNKSHTGCWANSQRAHAH